ncbi:hypothetical protein ES288_D05G247700v1 [Gossypium darwinii]|uniref:VQ domain-containing protein n=1 Tax=Gossypium darwinii TaxID=34276 RepID=A0A5D2CN41_GOSDA|nr:hypothetical protein ES288_D05G247700v1 [Gossypium darwinii]
MTPVKVVCGGGCCHFDSLVDRSCHSSGGSTTISTTTGSIGSSNVNNINDRDHYLKHLNKLSHKISKPSIANTPPIITKSSFDHTQALPPPQLQQSHPSQPHPQPQNPNQSCNAPLPETAQQNQPPVYNINKNNFKDVVQKLTDSPAHEWYSTSPPPIHQPKPQSSRLQRIRPPPLANVSNRPIGPMINYAVPNMNPPACSLPTLPISGPIGNSFIQWPPAATPLSPLPPFPVVHAAVESPVSAYLRYFQNSMPSTPHQQQPPQVPSKGIHQSQLPPSSLPFGCLNSPWSPYLLLSPSLLFSPNSSQLDFSLSSTVPVPSPKWQGL